MKKKEESDKNLLWKNFLFTITLLKTMHILMNIIFQGFFQKNPIKIAVHELTKTIFKIILTFQEAEIC